MLDKSVEHQARTRIARTIAGERISGKAKRTERFAAFVIAARPPEPLVLSLLKDSPSSKNSGPLQRTQAKSKCSPWRCAPSSVPTGSGRAAVSIKQMSKPLQSPRHHPPEQSHLVAHKRKPLVEAEHRRRANAPCVEMPVPGGPRGVLGVRAGRSGGGCEAETGALGGRFGHWALLWVWGARGCMGEWGV